MFSMQHLQYTNLYLVKRSRGLLESHTLICVLLAQLITEEMNAFNFTENNSEST